MSKIKIKVPYRKVWSEDGWEVRSSIDPEVDGLEGSIDVPLPEDIVDYVVQLGNTRYFERCKKHN